MSSRFIGEADDFDLIALGDELDSDDLDSEDDSECECDAEDKAANGESGDCACHLPDGLSLSFPLTEGFKSKAEDADNG